MAKPQTISLASLNIQQLMNLKKQYEEELGKLTATIQLTNDTVLKTTNAREELKSFSKSTGKTMLVPITESLYVTGKVAEDNRPLIELGTGYYAETSIEKADAFFARRVARLNKQQETLKTNFKEKQHQYQIVVQIMNQKLQAAQQH